MPQLSPAGQTAIQDMAQRHGFSYDAAVSMLDSVINGNGSQAQFSHPEFGGSGQWMQGGMTMVGDMFNGYLKGRVANLCADLSNLIASQPGLVRTGSFQSQSQGGHTSTNSWGNAAAYNDNGNNLFMPPPRTGGARTCVTPTAQVAKTACVTHGSARRAGWRWR